tara:strand:+ start:340 stop:831 length:492 start_codon:yes stop_codon:yes gene_type:complete
MARLTIDTGTEGNPATGDTLRGAMTKINTNFEEVFGLVGSDNDTGLITPTLTNSNLILQPNGTGIIEVDKLSINDASITSTVTNGDITITANGTGDIVLDSVTISDNIIKANRSNDNLQLDATGTGAVEMIPAKILMANLPTSDPSVAGQLFRDGTDLKVSTG